MSQGKTFEKMNHNQRMSFICQRCDQAVIVSQRKAFHDKVLNMVNKK